MKFESFKGKMSAKLLKDRYSHNDLVDESSSLNFVWTIWQCPWSFKNLVLVFDPLLRIGLEK